MINCILKSKVRTALFRLYFSNVDAAYYLRELERILSIPVAMIRKELLQLEKEGIFVSSRKGNLVFYSLNKDFPLFDELKGIVLKTVGAAGLLKEQLAAVPGIEIAFIFGSFARSDENLMSDIDVFIIGKPEEAELLRAIRKAECMLKREINYVMHSRSEYQIRKKKGDPFIKEILSKPKIFLIGKESEL